MNCIEVKVSSTYEVIVGEALLNRSGLLIKKIKDPCKALIVTDTIVGPLYSEVVKKSLESQGYKVHMHIITAGEENKNWQTAGQILESLGKLKFSRSDIIIALGGGVVGDISGFCASIYMRGIAYVQIPTTFLAAVDSSVGGKTAVDMDTGKNSVGAFHQPKLVICDVDTFQTLGEDIFLDGLCETIKYGCILDEDLFELIKEGNPREKAKEIVTTCVKLKAGIVEKDEYDNGLRQILNFGHTIGHGIEILSKFEISHGKAVAIGMYTIEKAMGNSTAEEIKDILTAYNIPYRCNCSGSELGKLALADKKVKDNQITLVTLEKIGKASLKKIKTDEIEQLFIKGIE